VVYRLDRLARDLIIQETVLAEVKWAGGRVFSPPAPPTFLYPHRPTNGTITQ